MTLKTQITTDLATFFNLSDFAESVIYNGFTITAVVSYGQLMSPDAGAVKAVKTLWVNDSDVPAPSYRDTVIIDSDTWYVGPEEAFRTDGNVWELPLYRAERPKL